MTLTLTLTYRDAPMADIGGRLARGSVIVTSPDLGDATPRPMTDEEIDRQRPDHYRATYRKRVAYCAAEGWPWPCPFARLLATLDSVRATVVR